MNSTVSIIIVAVVFILLVIKIIRFGCKRRTAQRTRIAASEDVDDIYDNGVRRYNKSGYLRTDRTVFVNGILTTFPQYKVLKDAEFVTVIGKSGDEEAGEGAEGFVVTRIHSSVTISYTNSKGKKRSWDFPVSTSGVDALILVRSDLSRSTGNTQRQAVRRL